jgi:hypothetical protein
MVLNKMLEYDIHILNKITKLVIRSVQGESRGAGKGANFG